MNRAFLILAGLLVVFLSGCIVPQPPASPRLPPDFEVVYSTGATHAEWGRYAFEANAEGKASFTKSMGMALEKKQEFNVTKSELLEIYGAAVENNFFGLQETYQDPNTLDGSSSYLVITADGSTKGVSIVNTQQAQFGAVAGKIRELIVLKVGDAAFSFEDLRDDCGTKETECKPLLERDCGEDLACEEEQVVCSEWEDFCDWETSV